MSEFCKRFEEYVSADKLAAGHDGGSDLVLEYAPIVIAAEGFSDLSYPAEASILQTARGCRMYAPPHRRS